MSDYRWYSYEFDRRRAPSNRAIDRALDVFYPKASDVLEVELEDADEIARHGHTPISHAFRLSWYVQSSRGYPAVRTVKRALDDAINPDRSTLRSDAL